MTTTAQKISRLLGDDGRTWESKDGASLSDLCRANGATVERYAGGTVAYRFTDGSGIVAETGGWDLALSPRCTCWAGAGHADDCQAER